MIQFPPGGHAAALALAALAAGLWVVYGGGGDTTYRRRAVVGLLLALSGVIGVWGIAFFSFDLVRLVLQRKFEAEGLLEPGQGGLGVLVEHGGTHGNGHGASSFKF